MKYAPVVRPCCDPVCDLACLPRVVKVGRGAGIPQGLCLSVRPQWGCGLGTTHVRPGPCRVSCPAPITRKVSLIPETQTCMANHGLAERPYVASRRTWERPGSGSGSGSGWGAPNLQWQLSSEVLYSDPRPQRRSRRSSRSSWRMSPCRPPSPGCLASRERRGKASVMLVRIPCQMRNAPA